MQGKDETQRTESLLTTGELGHLLPRFVLRTDLEHDAFREWVELIDRLQFCISPICNQSVDLLHVVCDQLESALELGTSLLLKIVMV